MSIATKRSIMTLFSDPLDLYSHLARFVMAEKKLTPDIIMVDIANKPKELYQYHPQGLLPILVDRDLVLSDPRIIMEYLDERFPHPPLLPVYPVARAFARTMILHIEKDWYSLVHEIKIGEVQKAQAARVKLQESLLALEPIFANKAFFNNSEFSLLDCWAAPLMWRLRTLGIELPKESVATHNYIARIFNRDTFQSSLSNAERELRESYDFN